MPRAPWRWSGCAPKDDAKQAETLRHGKRLSSEATVPDETLEFDIAVVGAGCSGLAACVQAAESGASVICIEAKSIAGGAAGGVEGLFAVNSQIQKDQNITVSMGEMIRTELEQDQYRNSGLVLRDLVKVVGEDIDWLVSKGVRFGKVDNYVGFHPIFHWFETGTGAESDIAPMEPGGPSAKGWSSFSTPMPTSSSAMRTALSSVCLRRRPTEPSSRSMRARLSWPRASPERRASRLARRVWVHRGELHPHDHGLRRLGPRYGHRRWRRQQYLEYGHARRHRLGPGSACVLRGRLFLLGHELPGRTFPGCCG